MEDKNWMELMMKQTQLVRVLETNQYTEKYGLVLSAEDAELLAEERIHCLKNEKRVEFGESILPRIIDVFCNSPYMIQSNYVETLIRLQEIFYAYKNEMEDEITDEELLNFMREQFDEICRGDLEYLEGTCLDLFAQAIRAGYRGYIRTRGTGEMKKFDLVPRWDRELYLEALQELFWR